MSASALKLLIKKGVASSIAMDVFVCTVLSVDKSTDTAKMQEHSTGLEIDVNLRATDDKTDNPYVIYPKVDSICRVASDRQAREFYVLLCDAVDSISLRGDEYNLVIDITLKSELAKMQAYITAFKTATVSALNGIIAGSGAAVDTALLSQSLGDFSKISNENVKHG